MLRPDKSGECHMCELPLSRNFGTFGCETRQMRNKPHPERLLKRTIPNPSQASRVHLPVFSYLAVSLAAGPAAPLLLHFCSTHHGRSTQRDLARLPFRCQSAAPRSAPRRAVPQLPQLAHVLSLCPLTLNPRALIKPPGQVSTDESISCGPAA